MARLELPGIFRDRPLLLELFVTANLAFLVLDIWLAHSVNDFHHWAEWIPLGYSAAGAALLALNLVLPGDPLDRSPGGAEAETEGAEGEVDAPEEPLRAADRGRGWWIGVAVGALGILVGVSGLVWHLESQFFELRTLRSLVYSAPFVAPLAFTGLGLLLVLNRLTPHGSREWGVWIVFLAFGGFVGNFGLSLLDHAQNGFFHPAEWIAVAVSALAVGYLAIPVLFRAERDYLRLGWAVMGLQILAGVAGFVLHLVPALAETSVPLMDRVVYGPPLFAPLLFANLAVLGGLGLWDLAEKPAPEAGGEGSGEEPDGEAAPGGTAGSAAPA